MARARGIRAGQAYVEIGADDASLRRSLVKSKALLRDFGKFAVAAGAAMAAGAAAATKVYAGFEYQIAKVSTMVENTGRWMGMFTSGIRDMAVEFGKSTQTLADGLYDVLSAQVPAGQAMDMLAAATRAAVGGFTDVGTSVQAFVRLMKSYNLAATQAADISDLLFRIVEKGVINYEQLAANIGKIAPTAQAAGLSLEEMAAAIATVVTVEEPERAVTALRQSLYEAAEAGVDFMSFIKRFQGASLADVIAAGIPKRGAQGVLILANNYRLLQDNIAAMGARAGAAQRAYEKMADTLTFRWRRLEQSAKVSLGKIGETFREKAIATAEKLISVMEWAGNAVPAALQKIAAYLAPIAEGARFAFGHLIIEVTAAMRSLDGLDNLTVEVMNMLQKNVLGALKVISFGFRNWRKILDIAATSVILGVVKVGNDVKHVFTVRIPAYLKWLRKNWRNIINDIISMHTVMAQNLIANAKRLWRAIGDVFAGKGFTFEPVGLLEGFEASMSDLPEIAARALGPLEKDLKARLADLMVDLKDDWHVHAEEFEKAVRNIGAPARDNFQGLAGGVPGPGASPAAAANGMRTAAGLAKGTFSAMSIQALKMPQMQNMLGELRNIAATSGKIENNTRRMAENQLEFT